MKPVSFALYCQFVILITMITGIGMFLFCVMSGVNIMVLHDTSNPLLYLGIGTIFSVVYVVKKYEHKIKGEVEG